jgi:L-threonylcarbamoyladenylate synthase
VIGKVTVNQNIHSNFIAPGMMDAHYSPLTPIKIGNIKRMLTQYEGKKIGILAFDKYAKGLGKGHQFVLSEKRDLDEAATRLFTGLRHLDSLNLQLILNLQNCRNPASAS